MYHPTTRSERRYAREVARNRRRTHIIVNCWYTLDPSENGGWNKGGKQYFACGNRCLSATLNDYESHKEIKRLRRNKDFNED